MSSPTETPDHACPSVPAQGSPGHGDWQSWGECGFSSPPEPAPPRPFLQCLRLLFHAVRVPLLPQALASTFYF